MKNYLSREPRFNHRVNQKVGHLQNGSFWVPFPLCHFFLQRSSPLCHSLKSHKLWHEKDFLYIWLPKHTTLHQRRQKGQKLQF